METGQDFMCKWSDIAITPKSNTRQFYIILFSTRDSSISFYSQHGTVLYHFILNTGQFYIILFSTRDSSISFYSQHGTVLYHFILNTGQFYIILFSAISIDMKIEIAFFFYTAKFCGITQMTRFSFKNKMIGSTQKAIGKKVQMSVLGETTTRIRIHTPKLHYPLH